ncbi:winged helix-turn-helix domain-containing protein [Erythrobacter sp. NE805]|uniref:winged helix-turn-helix domain-containing protein n=1 Tax=Erythrobacter sp. NE805 TaxID=3389875 RepID=UPI00396B2DB7
MARRSPLRLKIQIMCGDEIAMGPGKAELLEAIAAQRSISAAGRAMGMSYRRAWLLVDAMNRCWQGPLVATVPGNPKAGAQLTALGERVRAAYRRMETAAAAGAAQDMAVLAEHLLAAPLAPRGQEEPGESDLSAAP